MKRKWVHLSSAKEIAAEVGQRRALRPVVLKVNVKDARKSGLRFFQVTERVFLCRKVPPEYIKLL